MTIIYNYIECCRFFLIHLMFRLICFADFSCCHFPVSRCLVSVCVGVYASVCVSVCVCKFVYMCYLLRKRILPGSYEYEKLANKESNIFCRTAQVTLSFSLTLISIFKVKMLKFYLFDKSIVNVRDRTLKCHQIGNQVWILIGILTFDLDPF